MRDLPVAFWLFATVVAGVSHPIGQAPRWLLTHLVLLGAVTHAILVWSRFFSDALLHSASGRLDRRGQNARLLVLNCAAGGVVAGVMVDGWLLTVLGATGVGVTVVWHGTTLALRLRRALPARFGMTVRYYVAAACLLPAGVLLGVLLVRGLGPLQGQVMLAHAVVNVLGWMGFTVLGTLVTLWPTMLRTKVAGGAEAAAARALPVLVAAVVVAAGGALLGVRLLTALGVVGYLGGIAVLAPPFVRAARHKVPGGYPTWSVLAAVVWLIGCLGVLAARLTVAPSWRAAYQAFTDVSPFLAAGFGAQILLGALSYLVPVALGGGPRAIRRATTALGAAGGLRVTVQNVGLVLCLVPLPDLVRSLVLALVLASVAAFLALLVVAMAVSRRATRGSDPLPAHHERKDASGASPDSSRRPPT